MMMLRGEGIEIGDSTNCVGPFGETQISRRDRNTKGRLRGAGKGVVKGEGG